MQSYGPDNYTAYGCYIFPPSANTSNVYATYQPSAGNSNIEIALNGSSLDFGYTPDTQDIEAGALMTYPASQTGETVIEIKFGISMRSTQQACTNLRDELKSEDGLYFTLENIQEAAEAEWEGVLGRVDLPNVEQEDQDIVNMLYSSVSVHSKISLDYLRLTI